MKRIASLAEDISGITADNVKSSDKEIVEKVKADVEAVDTTHASDAEKDELKDLIDHCDALLNTIKDVADETKDVIDGISSYDPDTVKSSDKEDLESLVSRIDDLLAGDHLTEEEREKLESVKGEAESLLDKISEVVEELDRIAEKAKGYDLGTVTADDKEALDKLINDMDQILQTENLTDEEISDLNGYKTKAENLLDRLKGVEELIGGLQEGVGGYEDSAVKSTDKGAIEQIIKDAENLAGTGNVTSEQQKILEDIVETGRELLDQIGKSMDAVNSDSIQAAEDITADNVSLEDKDTLNKALDDLKGALENYGDNYTEAERTQLQTKIDQISDAIHVIENTENVAGMIEALPAPDNIQLSDETTIRNAQQAYDALTDREKELIGSEWKEKLGSVQAALEQAKEDAAADGTPQTGENRNLWLWLALAFISGDAVLTLTVKRKRQKG